MLPPMGIEPGGHPVIHSDAYLTELTWQVLGIFNFTFVGYQLTFGH